MNTRNSDMLRDGAHSVLCMFMSLTVAVLEKCSSSHHSLTACEGAQHLVNSAKQHKIW